MYNSRVNSLSTLVLSAFTFLSYALCVSFFLLKYTFYLFVAGIPAFATGGYIRGERCFDLYGCSQSLCWNATFFEPHSNSCNDSESAFVNRTAGWMQSQYKDFPQELLKTFSVVFLTFAMFLLVPLISFLLTKIDVSPKSMRIYSRTTTSLLVIMNLISYIVTQGLFWSFDEYKPDLSPWAEDLISLSTRLADGVLISQMIGIILVLVYNEITQIQPNTTEFQPLLFHSGEHINSDED